MEDPHYLLPFEHFKDSKRLSQEKQRDTKKIRRQIPPLSASEISPLTEAFSIPLLQKDKFSWEDLWSNLKSKIQTASLKDLLNFHHKFKELSEDLPIWEQASLFLRERTFYNEDPHLFMFMQWPGQTTKGAIGGYLFFPHEDIETLLGIEGDVVYERPLMQHKLAISSRYGNPIAQYHLSQIFERYCPEPPEEEKDPSEKFIFYKDAQEHLKQAATQTFEVCLSDESFPHFYKGLILELQNNSEAAMPYFAQSSSFYPYALFQVYGASQDDAVQALLLDKFSSIPLPSFLASFAPLKMAQNIEDPLERFRAYLSLGAHFPEAFYWAALINFPTSELPRFQQSLKIRDEERPLLPFLSVLLYKYGGEAGLPSFFGKAADELKKHKKDLPPKFFNDELKYYYQQMAEKGIPEGYSLLGDIYREEGNMEAALTNYDLAAPFYQYKMREISDPSEHKKINEMSEQTLLKHFQELYQLADPHLMDTATTE